MNSPHEGHSVILEEFEELWTDIKANRGRSFEAACEALQVSAMGIRYLLDVTPPEMLTEVLVHALAKVAPEALSGVLDG